MLSLNLLSDIVPSIALEISPKLQNIDDSSALNVFIAHVQVFAIRGSLFME
jgi:hypothetical protein